jgi:hypothetical protein
MGIRMTSDDDTRDEELLDRYRRAGAASAGPSEAVREAILAESRRVAYQLAKQTPQHAIDVSRPAANDSRWKIPLFGTAGAALLAALLFAPRYWETAPPAQVSRQAAPVAAPAASPAAKVEAVKPSAGANSPQEIAAVQADRKSAKSSAALALSPPAAALAPPPNAAQNYAPVSPSFSSLAAAPPPLAARAKRPDLSTQSPEGGITASTSSVADSALRPATLESAVAQGDVARAASLLDQGAVIDARDAAGRTPLMLAVTEDKLEIVRVLLARGADPNAADNTGHTPLQQANKRNLQDIAALLEQSGAH